MLVKIKSENFTITTNGGNIWLNVDFGGNKVMICQDAHILGGNSGVHPDLGLELTLSDGYQIGGIVLVNS